MVQLVSRSRDLRVRRHDTCTWVAFLREYQQNCCEQAWELSLAPLVTPGGLSHNPYKVLKDGYVPTAGNAKALRDMNDTNVSDLDVRKAPSIVLAPPSSSNWASWCRCSGYVLCGLCFVARGLV